MTKKTTTQICPICQKQHDEPVGVTRPTCGNPSCVREARSRGLPWVISHDPDFSPEKEREAKARKPRQKK